jgi:16S rRNA (guanine527-N7)-methyltransferase
VTTVRAWDEVDADGYGPDDVSRALDVSRETMVRVARFLGLLMAWRTRLNLIGPGEGRRLWRRHVLDSLQLLRHLTPADQRIADLGSGAGLPGLALACVLKDWWNPELVLVEKSPKKCTFLLAAVSELDVRATVLNRRSDEGEPIAADVVTARALAPLPRLLELAHPWIGPGGRGLFLKGADAGEELTEARKSWTFDLDRQASLSGPDGQVLTIRKLLGRML